MPRPTLTAGLALLLLCASMALGAARLAQDANPHQLPEDLQQFWRDYALGKDADDKPTMDKAVRRYRERAVRTLDLLLDEYSLKASPDLPDEMRALGMSLGRVEGHSHYIDRVRFVLDLEPDQRKARSEGLKAMSAATELFDKAHESKLPEDWTAASIALTPLRKLWLELHDAEQAVRCLDLMAQCEEGLGHTAQQVALLRQLVEQGGKLAYKDEIVVRARLTLEDLANVPTTETPPAEGAPADGQAAQPAPEPAAEAQPGDELKHFEAGSSPITVALKDDKGSKGIGAVVLPNFVAPEQYLIWPNSFWGSTDPQPSPFDANRAVQLQPFGTQMTLEREGARYKFDTNNDGSFDLVTALNNTPQRFELLAPDGKSFYPIMLSVPGDKEDVFGVPTNYAPTKESARVRFAVGGSLDGDVLGQPWKIYDANLSGRFGDAAVLYGGDGVTERDSLENLYFETDAVLVGKSKAALPWSTAMPVGEDFYRAEIGGDGRTLTLQKLALETGQLKLDMATEVQPTHLVLCGTGPLEGAFFNVVPAKKGGTVKLPAGSYRIASGRIELGKKTSMKIARIYQGSSVAIDVKPGETATLSLGAPYKPTVRTTSQDGAGIVIGSSVRIFGRAGEEYAMLFDDPLQPQVDVRTKSGKKLVKGDRMARAGVEEYQTNPSGRNVDLWFPANYIFELPPGESFEVRLMQETHPLLGGPFDSDWIP